MYNGSGNATFTLPAALAAGSGNFKGRVYKIKNNSVNQLTIDAAGTETINNAAVVNISQGTTLELISTGITSGNTWEAVSGLPIIIDGIRQALASNGCTSCTAYDNAPVNNWVQITSGEYSALQSSLPGTSAYGASAATMGTAATNGFGVLQR